MISRVLQVALDARERGDHPFGALLDLNGEIVAEAGNRVVSDRDLTAHAELTLIRNLERSAQLHLLTAGVVYASCEPCPMCVGAMYWAGVRRVVFGLSHQRLNQLANLPDAEPVGFTISAAEIGSRGQPPMTFDGPHREDEAARAHQGFWH